MSRLRAHFRHQVVLGSTICILLLFASTALAQSGRRLSKSPAVPVPTPEVQTEKKPASDLARIPLIVGTTRIDIFAGVPSQIYDGVLQSCARRLKESGSVQVEVVTKEMTRSDAVNRAKAAKEGFVIWLTLRGEDQMRPSATDLDELFIEFVVFEAPTGKIKTQGNSYQGAYRKGGVVLGSPTGRSNQVVVESRLRVAAEDAAARILNALHITSAPGIPTQ